MKNSDLLDELHLQEFQKRTVQHVVARLFNMNQRRFLVADEVGLGKTKVAQGVIALATATRRNRNVLYLASSGHIVTQNLPKMKTEHLAPEFTGSLAALAETIYKNELRGKVIGITPIKDLRNDHFGTVGERGLLYRLLMNRHRTLMQDPEVRKFFMGGRVTEEVFAQYSSAAVPGQLRVDFEQHLAPEVIVQLKDPLYRKKHKRAIVGHLRAILAKCVLSKINPALIVVDEIQRFSDRLLTSTPTPQVEFLLKQPILILSATPYQADEHGDSSAKDPHKGFIDLVAFLNHKQPEKVEDVKRALSLMRSTLLDRKIQKVALQHAVDNLGNLLREFMVRTERPFDAHVERKTIEAPLEQNDLKALSQAMRLLQGSPSSAKNKRHRYGELVELWKSAPYVVSTLSRRYVTGLDFEKAVGDRLPTPAAFTSSQLNRKTPLTIPAHPRLRAIIKEMGRDAQGQRLWLPPSRPYVEDPLRSKEDPPSKTLVFTSWSAAPPAIATALNLHAEMRPGREKDLEFSRSHRSTGHSVPVRSVHVIGAPLWRFAECSDPFRSILTAGKQMSPSELIEDIRTQLASAGTLKVKRNSRSRNCVDLALGINAKPSYPPPSADTASYLQPALDLFKDIDQIDCPEVTPKDANLLAEMAAAAPGTCAYRSLRRAIPALDDNKRALFGAAIAIGSSITRFFQRPAAVAIVGHTKSGYPYWRRVLRYCLENDLQSVLDEYVYLLVKDSAEEDPGKLAQAVANTIHVALSTIGTLQVARPRPTNKLSYGVAMYARALGEHDSPIDEGMKVSSIRGSGTKKRLSKKGHANPLLTAFNSPFPPFVLTTTSTGQEGLDMHRYCRRLIHWNLPTSPLSLEQREGRVDRFLSLGVRTNIAKLDFSPHEWSSNSPAPNPWELLVQAAKRQTADSKSILAPLWHFGKGQPIKAIAVNIPFSREETTWKRLLEEASWYRLVLGQPDPNALLTRLSNGSNENRQEIAGVRLDLSPKAD